MSEVLATSPRLEGEAPTVEGRLADLMMFDEVRVGDYRLSESDKQKVVGALLHAASLKASRVGE